jgi:hypothetical protein
VDNERFVAGVIGGTIAVVLCTLIVTIGLNTYMHNRLCLESGASKIMGQCIRGDLTPEVMIAVGRR